MRNTHIYLLSYITFTLLLSSCNKTETYADQKAKEKHWINAFIEENKIDIISIEKFLTDTITNNPETGPDFSKNEYVYFQDKGVYMQIIRRGTGEAIADGERKVLTARYYEYAIFEADTLTINLYNTDPDIFTCIRSESVYSASFTSGNMFAIYGSAVPNGWIMALPYIKPGFYNGPPSAKIRLILPHNEGTRQAASNVYPCFYELTIMPQKWQ